MKIQLKRSSVLDSGSAKKPTPAQMEYGELAVNYNNTDPAIFIKDDNDAIIRIAGNESASFSGDYADLINKPTIGDGQITLKQGDTELGTFTVNQEGVTEITIPVGVELWDESNAELKPVTETNKILATGGASFNALIDEEINITAAAITANTTIETKLGNVHYFTVGSTSTYSPNVVYSTTESFDSRLSVGSTATITVISASSSSGYATGLSIDGIGQTVLWNGGEVPTEGSSSGVNAYSYQIIKTAAATYTVLASSSAFA